MAGRGRAARHKARACASPPPAFHTLNPPPLLLPVQRLELAGQLISLLFEDLFKRFNGDIKRTVRGTRAVVAGEGV